MNDYTILNKTRCINPLVNKKKATKLKILLVIAALPIVIYFWPSALGGESEALIVRGQSMLPTILPGSLIVTKTAPSYHIDDIISFNLIEPGGFGIPTINKIVVHRIIDETERGFVIKGDNNRNNDPGPTPPEVIRGKVFLVLPYFGDLVELFRNPIVLVGSSIATFAIQSEQKRRRKKKEKLRRIRLGLVSKPNNQVSQQEKKPKKGDYLLFYVSLALNILIYVLIQLSIFYELLSRSDMGDILTGFLFRQVTASFASTLSFAFYFVLIFGVYFFTKLVFPTKKKSRRISKIRSSSVFTEILGKNFNLQMSIAQIIWIGFILMSLFHLLTMSQGLFDSVFDPCDPKQEIC